MDLIDQYVNYGSQMQQRDALDVLQEFSDELKRFQGIVLDVGSGPGHVTKMLLLPCLKNVSKIVGADISEKMVCYAEKNYAHDEIRYIVLNIEMRELPKDQINKYHHIVSFNTLHWSYDIQQAFTNICKMLKPEGKALFSFLSFHGGFRAYLKLKDCPIYGPYLYDAHRYVPYFQRIEDQSPEKSLQNMLKQIGFKILHVSKREKSYTFNKQSLKNHVCAVNPFLTRLPHNMRNDFIEKLVDEILNETTIIRDKKINNENIDKLNLPYHVMVVYVQKPAVEISKI